MKKSLNKNELTSIYNHRIILEENLHDTVESFVRPVEVNSTVTDVWVVSITVSDVPKFTIE